jgi:hypothetical protein
LRYLVKARTRRIPGSPLQHQLEEIMLNSWMKIVRGCAALAILGAVSLAAARPADINPAALAFQKPDQIKWTAGGNGAQTAVLLGDPSKPGLYIVLNKWTAGHMSRPHFHPNDRYITVLSGTWWVGTGTKYDPDSTVPMPAGSFVTHFARQVHYDGAKEGDAVLEIVGEGPATSTPAEVK